MRSKTRMRLGFAMAMLVLAILGAGALQAQEPGEKTYASAQDAGKALYAAIKTADPAQIKQVLGDSSGKLISSGDDVQDKNNRAKFLERYEQMNRVSGQVDGSVVLIVGADNWPLPIPIRKNSAGQWYFDTKAGMEEMLYRRVGANEYDAMRVLAALYDAQQEYFAGTHDGATNVYAQKIISTPGKQDGLYWKVDEGQPKSPIGPLVAYATNQGYGGQAGKPEPFHGYYYRLLKGTLTAQGTKKDFLADGKMTGFAILAYPAEYRNSGVMTFVIDNKGDMHEKDLGPNTADTAGSLQYFSAKGWRTVSPDVLPNENPE